MSEPGVVACFICDLSLGESDIIVVKKKGVETLKKCSVKRKNRNHQSFLKGLEQVTVHRACQKMYINKKMIDAALRRQDNRSNEQAGVSSSTRGHTGGFDFKKHCFLCGEGNEEDFLSKQQRVPPEKRNFIHKVATKTAIKDSVMKAAEIRGDEWARKIQDRIRNENELHAVDAWYHHFCYRKLYQNPESGRKRGYRPASYVDITMEKIYSYLEENTEECQFSIEELVNLGEGVGPDKRTVKSRLENKYGEDILVAETDNKKTVVCFKNVGYKILNENWYANRKSNLQEERLRVVKAAAEIIVEDIRSQIYSTTEYPPSDNFFCNAESVIPDSLKLLFESIILKHKRGSLDTWKKKCIALSHAVIHAVRPRSFLSSVLTGVGAYLYRKFGSKLLNNVLSALGFATSYSEASLLELSSVLRSKKGGLRDDAFCQFVFDNADFNVDTLDGSGTFHAMGGIICVTPFAAVLPDENIQRLKKCSSAEVVKQAGNIDLKNFHRTEKGGLKTIIIEDLQKLCPISYDIIPSTTDLIWLYSKWSNNQSVPGWNGFMEQVTANAEYDRSKIICLPFINSPPSHYDTVYTSLLVASEKCRKLNQKACFVTFDQPLYLKARDIVANGLPELNNVYVRLGGFHLLMSFLGSIGVIMAGSGLNTLLSTIYAENSVDKIMTGHAYARAVRAHILTNVVLSSLVWDTVDLTEDEYGAMENLITNPDRSVILTASTDNSKILDIVNKFKDALRLLENNGPTAKLWVQYFNMTTLMKQFIESERTGNWNLHLETVQKLLPYFHSAGHFLYAKCGHLYLQDMLKLQETMEPSEYEKLTVKGHFTIRRSEKHWSGIWSDMTIEQTLMKDMKSYGGLTRGRGITDSVLARWTLGMVNLMNICSEVEVFTNVHSETSEQHVDMRGSRIDRDKNDCMKLLAWFSEHPPFSHTDVIMSLSSGVVGGAGVNCNMSQELGMKGVARIVGNNFQDIHFKRKDKVVTLASAVNSIKAGNITVVAVDPLTLFQRVCIVKQSEDDLELFFTYELAPYPMSLFSEEGMRKGTKSALYSTFTPLQNSDSLDNMNKFVVVDGGYLLHKVVWPRYASYSDIAKIYSSYVQKYYGTKVAVIFDGYPSDPARSGTKSSERLRRSKLHTSTDVVVKGNMINQVAQDKFLGNSNNKNRLIELLKSEFEQCGIIAQQAEEDADVLVVTVAISKSYEFDRVLIVGEDIDLLVLMTGLGQINKNIFFCKPGRGSAADMLFSTTSYKYDAGNILIIHAFTGCDTTSSPFGLGKMKCCTALEKLPQMKEIVEVFKKPDATSEEIAIAGETFLLALYSRKMNTGQSLDTLRYQLFTKSATKSKFNLSRLPPTQDAARQHSLRSYHQVQTWLGNVKKPEEWGWVRRAHGMEPITMTKEPAPESLLKVLSCSCKKGCTGTCTCRKAGLKCSNICKHCNGLTCTNVVELLHDLEDEEDEIVAMIEQIDAELDDTYYTQLDINN